MGENANSTSSTTTKAPAKKGFFKNLKSEFSKIVWPTKNTLAKQTVAVCFYAAALAAIISGLDFVFQLGVNELLSW